MEQWILHLTLLAFVVTDCLSLQCYQCYINPPPGHNENSTEPLRLCTRFDGSHKFVVDCPYSTMCMKQLFHLDIQNGVRIKGVLRDCAQQKHEYQDFIQGHWEPKVEILEPYTEGCQTVDDKGARTPSTVYCYCRNNLCNAAPKTNHEGYTDIMGVIVAFNLLKYIRSLR